MVFNATFDNISAISWPSVLLVKGNRSIRRKPSHTIKNVNIQKSTPTTATTDPPTLTHTYTRYYFMYQKGSYQ